MNLSHKTGALKSDNLQYNTLARWVDETNDASPKRYFFSKFLMHCPLQVTKCFVPVQIFWASPKIWLHLVPLQKLLCRHKNQFYWMQIIFLSGTKCLWLPQYINKFLVWHKKFGSAQNILGPVKGQGIKALKTLYFYFCKMIKNIRKLIETIFATSFAKNNTIFTWNIRCFVDESFVPATQRPSILYWRLSDFCAVLFISCAWKIFRCMIVWYRKKSRVPGMD